MTHFTYYRTVTGIRCRALLALAVLALGVLTPIGDAGRTSAQSAVSREPDVPYEPTPHNVVAEMVRLARMREGDLVYDLGCGDGRVVIAAIRESGAHGVCVDIDPERIRESRANAAAAGVPQRIRFLEQDLFATEIRAATVVMLFLSPEVNMKLRPKLWRELRPGTRVISYVHDMGDWKPERIVTVQGRWGERALHLWTIDASQGK
ncbi:MAG: class I SAM-dependent methyltransferase [Betaproteobacteria bacterium]|nr:class I SAM-dependent methyltransferase [Betaproteobacteria bacterium]